jgi:hypothetical protein
MKWRKRLSEFRKVKNNFAGELRPSELIYTNPPGSVFNGKDGLSVMMLGLDFWPHAKKPSSETTMFQIIHNKFLEDVCDKEHFRAPIIKEGDVESFFPCTVFPSWGYCSFCHIMTKMQGKPDPETGFYVCRHCHTKYKRRNKILPARLILLCEFGHVSEFPWIEWAHSAWGRGVHSQDSGICEKPLLTWRFGYGGTTLSSYTVRCLTCNKHRSMFGATEYSEEVLPSLNGGPFTFKCTGQKKTKK